jgi:hypothetical protein
MLTTRRTGYEIKGKVRAEVKVHLRTGHEGPKGE